MQNFKKLAIASAFIVLPSITLGLTCDTSSPEMATATIIPGTDNRLRVNIPRMDLPITLGGIPTGQWTQFNNVTLDMLEGIHDFKITGGIFSGLVNVSLNPNSQATYTYTSNGKVFGF